MEQTKNKIGSIVEKYKRENPQEYKTFCEANQVFKKTIRNEFAETGGQLSGRLLFETPETLYGLFLSELNTDELFYFKSSQGARWFAKTFKEFAVPEKI